MAMRLGLKMGVCALALAAAACSEAENSSYTETAAEAEVAQADMAAETTAEAAADASTVDIPAADSSVPELEMPATMPKIAYTYQYGFSLPGDDIVHLQQRHADMCEAKGPAICRILGMTGASAENEGQGRLELAVRSQVARGFGSELVQATQNAGGEQIATGITGEDLSKQMVDTEARLDARKALRDRLMDDLKKRRGSVQEVVQAEREVAKVTEEIEAAEAWIAEMQGRVSFSGMTLDYESSTPMGGSFARPVGDALGNIGGILGTVVAWLLMLGAAVLPVGAVVYGAARINRWAARREAGDAASEA